MKTILYANGVGSIMYGMVSSIPDLAHVVNRYLAYPEQDHWEALKWVLRYLNGTISFDLMYKWSTNNKDVIDCLYRE